MAADIIERRRRACPTTRASEIFDSILATVGNTPIVRLNALAPPRVNVFVKLEAFNPMGSVKDRLALGIIEDAERRGVLRPGQTVIEATSGNTGIGLAMVCAVKGYPLVVTMAENFSVERRKMMRFLGAKVVLTPAALKGSGMLAKAVELAQAHGWFLCRQFENEANADMHSRTTAPEILAAFEGERLDYWVTGYGTGGTLKGVARVLKAQRPETQVIVCEPDNSPILGSGIAQARLPDGTPSDSHPAFRPHLMQGWSPDFIPRLTEDALALQLALQRPLLGEARADDLQDGHLTRGPLRPQPALRGGDRRRYGRFWRKNAAGPSRSPGRGGIYASRSTALVPQSAARIPALGLHECRPTLKLSPARGVIRTTISEVRDDR